MADDRAKLGRRGEKLACKYLKKLGYRILARNYRCPVGEIDLIAMDGDVIAFAEVKTRSSEDAADVERAVGPAKQRQLTRTAKFYLTHCPAAQDHPCRFDILGIVSRDGDKPEIRHIPDAFDPV